MNTNFVDNLIYPSETYLVTVPLHTTDSKVWGFNNPEKSCYVFLANREPFATYGVMTRETRLEDVHFKVPVKLV